MAGDANLSTKDIFNQVLGRLLQEKLPNRFIHGLQEVRLKLTDKDSMNDMLQLVLANLNQLIHARPEPQVKSVQNTYTSPVKIENKFPRPLSYMSDPNPLTQIDECNSKRPDLIKRKVAKLSANMDGFARDGLLYGGMYQPWFDPYGPWQGFPILSSNRPTLPSITED